MSDVSVIGNAMVGGVQRTAPVEVLAKGGVDAPAAAGACRADRVEISEQAHLLEQLHALPEVRQDRIDAVTAAIADGSYITDEKLAIAVERLVDEIGG